MTEARLNNISDLIQTKETNLSRKHTKIITLESLDNNELFEKELDRNNIPILKRIEKYPNLSNDVFVDFEFVTKTEKYLPKGYYKINKKGEIWSIKSNKVISQALHHSGYYIVTLYIKNKQITVTVHKLVAKVFLLNPDDSIYDTVNHINHDITDNKLSNLEWVTKSINSSKELGKSNLIDDGYLTKYIALNDSGDEVFRITRRNNIVDGIKYYTNQIVSSSKNNKKYKGFYWRVEQGSLRKDKKEKQLKTINCTGNVNDYIWYKHPIYPEISVCKEGFIKINNRISMSFGKEYILLNCKSISNCDNSSKLSVNRVIAEFLEERKLDKDEIVDHINTNRLDNSFENLRVVRSLSENMNNKITKSKNSKFVIITDLSGNDIINYGFNSDLKKFFKHNRTATILNHGIIQKKYFCIEEGDKASLYKKMERITYIFHNNKLISFFTNSKDSLKFIKSLGCFIGKDKLLKYIQEGKEFGDNLLVLRGPKAVKKLIETDQGGNAANFSINKDEFSEKPRIIDYSRYEKYLEKPKRLTTINN